MKHSIQRGRELERGAPERETERDSGGLCAAAAAADADKADPFGLPLPFGLSPRHCVSLR